MAIVNIAMTQCCWSSGLQSMRLNASLYNKQTTSVH